MDRLEAMSVLVAAAEAGSFSAASRRLGVPLPTISRKVADLETQIGTRLLVRTTRKLTPTDAGAAYIDACKHILEQVAEAERTASGEYSAPRRLSRTIAQLLILRAGSFAALADALLSRCLRFICIWLRITRL